jgi:hypothetical protein
LEIILSITIERSVDKVFGFLSDFENHHQESDSQVLLLEKLTPGPSRIGTRYREMVRMLPFITVEMITDVTQMKPNKSLEFTWSGGGMDGVLEYHFDPRDDWTIVEFKERVIPKGIMKLVGPLIKASFHKTMVNRLDGIKGFLEGSI